MPFCRGCAAVGGVRQRYILAGIRPIIPVNSSCSFVYLRTRSLLSFPSSSFSSVSHLHTNTVSTTKLRQSLSRFSFKLASTQQTRDHIGHSHSRDASHHHHHDNTYLISKNRTDAGVRITRIGLYVNLFMAISKGIGGWYFNSQALVCSLEVLVLSFLCAASLVYGLSSVLMQRMEA